MRTKTHQTHTFELTVVALEACHLSNGVQVVAQRDEPFANEVTSVTFVVNKPKLPPEIGQKITVGVNFEGEVLS